MPDVAAGELPAAFVVLKPNQTVPEKEIIEFVNSKVSTYKHLRGGVFFVEQIPKSPSGKVSFLYFFYFSLSSIFGVRKGEGEGIIL
jgi:acyl-coenzyme A synthetase/AMP-(fatty) acid ligase